MYRQQSARSRGRCWVTRHRALWSSDFPPRPAEADRSDSPPFQNPAESISRLAKVYKGDSLSGGDDIESKLHHLGSIGGGRFREPLSRATSQRSTGQNVRGTQTQPIGKGARISGAARRAGWNEELLKILTRYLQRQPMCSAASAMCAGTSCLPLVDSRMPIYEFHCGKCGKDSEVLVRSSKWEGTSCPNCGSKKLTKKLSVFASSGAADAGPVCTGTPKSCGLCGTGKPHRN